MRAIRRISRGKPFDHDIVWIRRYGGCGWLYHGIRLCAPVQSADPVGTSFAKMTDGERLHLLICF